MLPPACRAPPAFGSGQRAGTVLSLQRELPRYQSAAWQWHKLFFQLLDKQPNFIFGLVGVCGDKIQLRSKSAAMRLWSHASIANARRVAIMYRNRFLRLRHPNFRLRVQHAKNQFEIT